MADIFMVASTDSRDMQLGVDMHLLLRSVTKADTVKLKRKKSSYRFVA